MEKTECLISPVSIDYIALGRRVRQARKSLFLTQAEIANRMGCSVSFYGHLERGTRKASIQTLSSLSKVLSISTDYLLFGRDTSKEGESLSIVIEPSNPLLYALVKVIMENADKWQHQEKPQKGKRRSSR